MLFISKVERTNIIHFYLIILFILGLQSSDAQDQFPLQEAMNSSGLAELSGDYYDHGVAEIDSDGKYDFLVFDIGVNVQLPGEYSLIGTLCNPFNRDIAWSIDHRNLSQGYNSMHLIFDGKTIREKELNSSYFLSNLQLVYGSSPKVLDVCDFFPKTYISSFYNYTDFACNSRNFMNQNRSRMTISGNGAGDMVLTISVKKYLPVISGMYSYDIVGIRIPPIEFRNVTSTLNTGYSYSLPGIYIPGKPNDVAVSVSKVKNLNIGLRKLQGSYENYNSVWKVKGIRTWITTQALSNHNRTATMTSDLLSPGSYHIKIFGDAADNVSQVDLTMTLAKKVIVKGRFNMSINTTGYPTGNYSITAKALNGSFNMNNLDVIYQ